MAKKIKGIMLAAAMSLGVVSAAQAWELTIWCYGTNEHCATVYVDGWIIDIYLGNIIGIEFVS